jgi:hypothetical protein
VPVVDRLQAGRYSRAPCLDGTGVVRQGYKKKRADTRQDERQEPGNLV